ncbi:RNA polymerase I-specific transcription initiation factor RRN3 family protein [Laccaria bicolor S238N-H82]|uniref:Predicted protein n=1 Tax=Laccaria bicolor (strain S238N-H82 / ATCC MYA-4686) TaxID=486041 RepID=B0CXN3_LACBS|nr:RNA polymerase I-specific transcription initiation factor RRN3 family protein [Laccaria bicolor S238N-H82]EDR12293.1 predicted protein [Laccaria bicolor S238N-H82]|eukprot:XP_001876557.1 RNA polymerase I-specific transcription initiation factor RRN3 family protein [Laccaria bicolor S238N-H82]
MKDPHQKYPPKHTQGAPAPSSLLIRRPIATNSRIKQDQNVRRDMYLAFVNNALHEKSIGNSESFDQLVNQFNFKSSSNDAPTQPAQLRVWIAALSHIVSRLERTHSALVEALVNMPWTTLDSATVKSYTVFIGMLLSARPEYLSLVLGKIAQGFTHRAPLTRRVIYDRLHNLLGHILSLIPTLPSTLQPLLVRHFPHKRQNQVVQTTYIRNLLRVSTYCPELSDKILATIVDRAIQIDVEIQVEIEELEEEENIQDQDDMVKKLDAILTLIFQHFHRTYTSLSASSSSNTRLSSPAELLPLPPLPSTLTIPLTPSFDSHAQASKSSSLRIQFHSLLSIFDRTILRTFKSRYTQFLVFWYTSLDPEFADIFQGMLVDRAFSPTTPELTRAAAASYIGSFVSRATFVDGDGARRVVAVLCEYLQAHLDGVEEAIKLHGDDWVGGAQHAVFYAVAQAVFLIFCFRWRDLLQDADVDDEVGLRSSNVSGKNKWIPELSVLKRVVISVLNPLKVCSPNVVMQFARVAHHTDFIYCYTILESNKRSEYGPSPNSIPNSNTTLNTFFPFDPYRLPRSNVFIQGVYREWAAVAIDDDDDDDENEDEDGCKDIDDLAGNGYLNIPQPSRSQDEDDTGLGASLGGMSISPKFR